MQRFAKFKPHPAESKEVAADDGKESKPEEDKEQVDFSPEDYQPAWNCVNMDSTLRDIILEFVNGSHVLANFLVLFRRGRVMVWLI